MIWSTLKNDHKNGIRTRSQSHRISWENVGPIFNHKVGMLTMIVDQKLLSSLENLRPPRESTERDVFSRETRSHKIWYKDIRAYLYSILFYIILYYSILFYIILYYSILLYYRFRSYPHGSLLGLRRPWDPRGHCGESLHGLSEWGRGRWTMGFSQLGMGQYLLIQFLMGWTSIYQLFWCSPGVQGFDTLPIGNWWLCPHHSCHSSDSKHCPDWNRWWHETCTQKRQDFLCNEAKLSQLPGLWGPVLWNSWRVSKPWTGPTSKQRPSLAVLWTTRSLRDRGCLHEMETVGR